MNTTSISFKQNDLSFSRELTKRVNDYFTSEKIEKTGNWKLYSKTIILVSLFLTSYALLVFFPPTFEGHFSLTILLNICLCFVLGLTFADIGFNVMHDGAHGSYSKYEWVNQIMGRALNLVGGFVMYWKTDHNQDHHNFTNVYGGDRDIDNSPLIRTSPYDPTYWYSKYQYYVAYWAFFYSFTYVRWIWYQDFVRYFTTKVQDLGLRSRKAIFYYHVEFWITKMTHISLFIILPIIKVGILSTIIGYLTTALACGLCISIVFQLAHIVPNAEFVKPNSEHKIEDNWMRHQLKTTVNFANNSKVLLWLLGGLNYQIEHHLFPKISHIHYPKIKLIVMEVCQKYGVEYKEYPTFLSAIRAHMDHLKQMGTAT